MKILGAAIATVSILLIGTSACAVNKRNEGILLNAEISQILSEIEASQNAIITQEKNGDFNLLYVLDNFRETDFGGCLATEKILEVSRSNGVASISNGSEIEKVSFSSCHNSSESNYSIIDGAYSAKLMTNALSDLELLKNKRIDDKKVLLVEPTMKAFVTKIDRNKIAAISFYDDSKIRFQVEIDELLPKYLGVELIYDGDSLESVRIDDADTLEMVR